MPEPALVFAEPSGVVRTWNAAAEFLFGHQADEAIGQTLDIVVPPEYRARHWAGFKEAMEAGDGNIDHSSFDIPALRRDGTVIRVEVRLLVIHDSRDRAVGAMAVLTPVEENAPPLTRL